eukprot:m.105324 g.105324  ORF g.105324 m.105324 type:complete len:370 (-) comp22488_c0_seq3:80-1189(-)
MNFEILNAPACALRKIVPLVVAIKAHQPQSTVCPNLQRKRPPRNKAEQRNQNMRYAIVKQQQAKDLLNRHLEIANTERDNGNKCKYYLMMMCLANAKVLRQEDPRLNSLGVHGEKLFQHLWQVLFAGSENVPVINNNSLREFCRQYPLCPEAPSVSRVNKPELQAIAGLALLMRNIIGNWLEIKVKTLYDKTSQGLEHFDFRSLGIKRNEAKLSTPQLKKLHEDIAALTVSRKASGQMTTSTTKKQGPGARLSTSTSNDHDGEDYDPQPEEIVFPDQESVSPVSDQDEEDDQQEDQHQENPQKEDDDHQEDEDDLELTSRAVPSPTGKRAYQSQGDLRQARTKATIRQRDPSSKQPHPAKRCRRGAAIS